MIEIFTVENIVALLTLTALEIVLGIDNVVFIAILAGKLPKEQQQKARQVGLALALISRLGLLMMISWIMHLTQPLFEVVGKGFSGRDIILLAGGLFLIGKATYEIHHKIESTGEEHQSAPSHPSFFSTVMQIMVIDIVFSLDSVITAVGMAKHLWVMVTAVIISIGVMLLFAGKISSFIEKHPTFKVLALSFLLLIGVMLMVEGLGEHFNKGYIYFAMGFSLFVEMINMRIRPAKSA